MKKPETFEDMRALALALLMKLGGEADLTYEEYGEGTIAAKFNGISVGVEGSVLGVHVSVLPGPARAQEQQQRNGAA